MATLQCRPCPWYKFPLTGFASAFPPLSAAPGPRPSSDPQPSPQRPRPSALPSPLSPPSTPLAPQPSSALSPLPSASPHSFPRPPALLSAQSMPFPSLSSAPSEGYFEKLPELLMCHSYSSFHYNLGFRHSLVESSFSCISNFLNEKYIAVIIMQVIIMIVIAIMMIMMIGIMILMIMTVKC